MTLLPREPIKWAELSSEERDRLMHTRIFGNPVQCPGKLIVSKVDVPSRAGGIAWSHFQAVCTSCELSHGYMDESDIPKEHTSMEDIPHCSTDMNAAWLIVGHMTKLPKTFLVASELRASRFALWWEKENLWAMSASDAANAICVESLHICGVEVVNG